ncbi:MAG: hypothetical protein H6953_12360 [Chromatiaceae bacterium]|nr:hypothetical protein [Chromatiaceae bacterium]MCP5315858.1 hypothetical protein [Chromatiaceae bacterium]
MAEMRIDGSAASAAASALSGAAGSVNPEAMSSFSAALTQAFPSAGGQHHHAGGGGGGGGGGSASGADTHSTIDQMSSAFVQLGDQDNVIEMVMTALKKKGGVQEEELKAQKEAFDRTTTQLENQIKLQSYFSSGSTNSDGVNVNTDPITLTDPNTGQEVTYPYTDSSGNTVTVLDYESQTYGITPPAVGSDGTVDQSACTSYEQSVSGEVQTLNSTSTEQQQELQETVTDYQNTNSLVSTLQSDLKSILSGIIQNTR